jgi:hypothetical protein
LDDRFTSNLRAPPGLARDQIDPFRSSGSDQSQPCCRGRMLAVAVRSVGDASISAGEYRYVVFLRIIVRTNRDPAGRATRPLP